MEATIMSLPNELLLYIFLLLRRSDILRCYRVCKHWSTLVLDMRCWKGSRLVFRDCLGIKDSDFLHKLLRSKANELTGLELRGPLAGNLEDFTKKALPSKIFTSFQFKFPKLLTLDLSFTDITSYALFSLISELKLCDLILEGCFNVTDDFFLLVEISPETVLLREDLKYIYIGSTSCSVISIKTLLNEELFPNLDLIDISDLQLSIYDSEHIRDVYLLRDSPVVYQQPHIRGMPYWKDNHGDDNGREDGDFSDYLEWQYPWTI